MENHISLKTGLKKLQKSGKDFLELFTNGSLIVEIYKPNKTDFQLPHKKDEVYIIISGTGTFFNNGERTSFKPGDFLFVNAGIEHRFEDFSEDFATWVIFYGPLGGEKK